MTLPFGLVLRSDEVALVTECEGVFVIEPMQFLYPGAARAKAKRLASEAKARTTRRAAA